MKLRLLVLLTTFSSFAAEDLPVPPMPPTPPAMHECVVTNITILDTNRIFTNRITGEPEFAAAVRIVPKNCPKVWYYGIVDGQRRQWCVHDHEATGFEAGLFETGVTHLWRTKYHIEDLTVIKVKEQQPRVWKIPAQASK